MLVTVVFGNDPLSAETKARSSSFAEVVENESVLTVVLDEAASLEAVASMAIAARAGWAQKLMITLGRATQIKFRILFMVVLCVLHFFYTLARNRVVKATGTSFGSGEAACKQKLKR